MYLIADLHLHSKYSRAVSQAMNLEEIASWAQRKGIDLVATADWTHPLWFREIKNKLEEVEKGVYSLKQADKSLKKIRFILATEVSSIYSQNNKVYRIHNLIFAPSLVVAEKIINELNRRGVNLMADGRPTMGISARDLYALILEVDENSFLIPCHIWTPWFSLYGSRSGFDSINECFLDYEKYITAVETGLSSDPSMNWQIKELDERAIVSFSDAHSGPKLGREATVFTTNSVSSKKNHNQFNYFDIIDGLKKKQNSYLKIAYTIEFFPEEGKYHWSGHRQCQVRYSPEEEKEKGKICPVCGKPLTIGVESRVSYLASRFFKKEDLLFLKNKNDVVFVYDKEKKRIPYVSLVPLNEILTEVYHSPIKVKQEYEKITQIFPEFEFLLRTPYEEIRRITDEKVELAIRKVRNREVLVEPGYDGVFGVVKIFQNRETVDGKSETTTQSTLF
jgi:uncharacterized protein (TIGR00375 family)